MVAFMNQTNGFWFTTGASSPALNKRKTNDSKEPRETNCWEASGMVGMALEFACAHGLQSPSPIAAKKKARTNNATINPQRSFFYLLIFGDMKEPNS